MEAKVDVRKLQVLNDRISQTIDALNQVRFSVHGLGHTGVPQMMNPFGIGNIAQGFGFPPIPPVPGPLPISPTYAYPPIPSMFGLQHTPYTPYAPPVTPPFASPGFMNPPFLAPFTPPVTPPTPGITPSWNLPPTPWFGGGLFHTPMDPIELKLLESRILENRILDPYRIVQTFPYVLS